MKRREFIRNTILVGAAISLPTFVIANVEKPEQYTNINTEDWNLWDQCWEKLLNSKPKTIFDINKECKDMERIYRNMSARNKYTVHGRYMSIHIKHLRKLKTILMNQR